MTTKYLMNSVTGSVDTEENWKAEMPTWEGDQQAQFYALVEVASLDGKTWHAMDVFANLMDDDLREELSARAWGSEQEFLSAYAEAHAAKFDGEQFSVE